MASTHKWRCRDNTPDNLAYMLIKRDSNYVPFNCLLLYTALPHGGVREKLPQPRSACATLLLPLHARDQIA